jgi:hypothetical protein
VQPSASFITVSPASGSGNASVTYTVAANTGAARSASIVINGIALNFTQESPKAPATCTIALSSASSSLAATSSTATVNVTSTNANCAWTAAADSSSFLTVSPASGSGNGTVTITAPANSGGQRTGTVVIGGINFTVTQAGSGLIASFQLLDPGQTAGPVTECRIRGTGSTTCTLQSTSFSKTNNIVLYEWQIQYTYVTIKTSNPSSTFPTTTITDSCGQTGASDGGTQQPLSVLLKVTDSQGNTATATAGTGDQPPLFITLYTCGL